MPDAIGIAVVTERACGPPATSVEARGKGGACKGSGRPTAEDLREERPEEVAACGGGPTAGVREVEYSVDTGDAGAYEMQGERPPSCIIHHLLPPPKSGMTGARVWGKLHTLQGE